MNRLPVESSNISSIGHDSTGIEIEFKSGSIHHFPGIDTAEYQRLINGIGTDGSVGRYFAKFIKPRFERAGGQ